MTENSLYDFSFPLPTGSVVYGDKAYYAYNEPIPLMSEYVKLPFSRRAADMPGRCEGMSDAEWELVEDMFPDKGEKKPWNGCGASAQGFEFAAFHFGNWLPLVRSSARRARVLAEDLAFRRKAQGIAGSCAECRANLLEIRRG